MSTINRFLSRRDKHTHGSHSKQEKSSNGFLYGLFVDDKNERHISKEDEKKIKVVQQRFVQAGIKPFDEADINYVLKSEYAKGDADRAYELLTILQDTEDGIIRPFDPSIKLLGAVNRQAVTCYLDALLFAMFARLESFEMILYKHFEDLPKKRLATLLRLWVNILRSGKLITVDITKQIQLQLAACGWEEAAKLCQQDASEAFTFITGTLALPLLTLKMDIFHTGREDVADDHKFINERLLELAIPEEPKDGHTITLEDCLELFFNNKIEVKRYLDSLERRNTMGSVRSRGSVDSTKASAAHVEVAEVEEGQPSTPEPLNTLVSFPASPPRPISRRRAPSIIQETYIDEKKGPVGENGFPLDEKKGHNRRVRKEVMMPAWQFFSLIPWYTNNIPSNDAQVAAHFSSTRPILGICLKRYYMMPNGRAAKRTTHIDIPLEIALPHFIQDEDMSEAGPAFGNFKLSLQSVVCHQGITVESGHYISLVRNPDPNREGPERWLCHDDLAAERVKEIDAEQFLKESNQQTPYLLFYQVIPNEQSSSKGSYFEDPAGSEEPPPSYADSVGSVDSKVDLATASTIETARPSLDYSNRASLELQMSNESRRGRSSLTVDRPQNTLPSDGKIGANSGTSGVRIDVQPPQVDSHPAFVDVANSVLTSGPNSLTADRRGSRSSKTSSKSRDTSRSLDRAEKRMSASLSRLASKITRDRSTHSSSSNSNVLTNIQTVVPVETGALPAVPASPLNNEPPAQSSVDPTIITQQQQQPQQMANPTQLPIQPPQQQPLVPSTSQPPSQPPLPISPTPLSTGPTAPLPEPGPALGSERDKSLDQPPPVVSDRTQTRLKKDKGKEKEKEATSNATYNQNTQTHHHHHHHLTKSGGGGEKPERECTVM